MFTFKTPEADLFSNSLKVGWEFVIRCNHQWEKAYSTIEQTPHTNLWKKQDAVLTQAKENLCKLEDRILTNIKENIKDQCGDNTYYYCWSALDLGDKSSVEERITKLLGILCTEESACCEEVYLQENGSSCASPFQWVQSEFWI